MDADAQARARIGTHYQPQSYNHHATAVPNGPTPSNNIFSASSSDAYDSDGEVLPLASTAERDRLPPSASAPASPGGATSRRGSEDSKWFQALDERYLLPIFSNATASRTFHARRQRRADAGHDLEEGEEMGEDMPPEPAPGGQVAAVMDESRMERGLPSPSLRNIAFMDNRSG